MRHILSKYSYNHEGKDTFSKRSTTSITAAHANFRLTLVHSLNVMIKQKHNEPYPFSDLSRSPSRTIAFASACSQRLTTLQIVSQRFNVVKI